MRRRRLGLLCLAGTVMLAAALYLYLWPIWTAHSRQRLLDRAQRAFQSQDYEMALQLCNHFLARAPDTPEALIVAGRAAMVLNRPEEARLHFQRLLRDPRQENAQTASAMGIVQIARGDAAEAERWFRRALRYDRNFVLAQQELAYLLGLQGRRHESKRLHLELVRGGEFSTDNLFALGHPTATLRSEDLQRFQDITPDNPLLWFPAAVELAEQGQLNEAERLLARIIEHDENQLDAQVSLGSMLLDRGTPEARLRSWHEGLPAAAEQHPGVWLLRGRWAQQLGQQREATRCYWEALRLDCDDRAACSQMARALAGEGHTELSQALANRARHLERLQGLLEAVMGGSAHLEQLQQTAELTETLGKLWEAHAWYQIIDRQVPRLVWAREGVERTAQRLAPDFPLVDSTANPVAGLDLSEYPLPRLDAAAPAVKDSAPSSTVSFRELATAAGIDFHYMNSEDPTTPGRRMFEFTGGGIAVLDYDRDGWPDLYFTQGCPWPPQPHQVEYLDRLYRNNGDGRFVDVTEAAGLGENRFSQGVAVGDMDNDGFADLLVANIGENRLYRNQTDGTFRDITAAAGLSGSRWTTSCLIADLNGDAWPDIYEVNYVEGEKVFDLICKRGDSYGICLPTDFAGQADRFFLSAGDCSFAERGQEVGLREEFPGLGVVAADFDRSGQLALFIANDMTANSFFVNSRPRGREPRFADQAILSGLAYERSGQSQACMGIAAGDADGDGLLDLFVTNFSREANTLYRQQPAASFLDDSHRAGLAAPSLPLLGFGTQFLDGELDGLPDLVVTNGHIHDLSHQGEPHEMQPQYFRNEGGSFRELTFGEGDGYFQRAVLGRSLALIDYNRDGREDFVVSHLDRPVALLLNESRGAGNFLAVNVRGTESARDAHGTQVTVSAGHRQLVRQLVAGGGYQASNQMQLVFGLGDAHVVDIQIQWPSGLEQVFPRRSVNRHLLFVEGRALDSVLPYSSVPSLALP